MNSNAPREARQAQVERVAYAWLDARHATNGYVSAIEGDPWLQSVVEVTVAFGGVARENVLRLSVDLEHNRVQDVASIPAPTWWSRDELTTELLAWIERCWPTIERAAERCGVGVAACTAAAVRPRWWLVGPATLWMIVEDVSRPVMLRRDTLIRCAADGTMLSRPADLWSSMKGRDKKWPINTPPNERRSTSHRSGDKG